MIDVANIHKSYGPIKAVNNVSFQINKGEIVGLLGPNGAGKSTLMKILTGYHYPDAGVVSIGGFDLFDDSLKLKQIIGYLPEDTPLYTDFKVREYLDIIADIRKIETTKKKHVIEKCIEECGLYEVKDQLIDTLSKGFRQRVGLAQAIIHKPGILILDEPTTGLDPNQIIWIRGMIKDLARSTTILLSTHILQEVEAVCERVFILNKGQIVEEGKAEDIGSRIQPDRQYTLTIDGDLDAPAAAALERTNGFLRIEIKKQTENAVTEVEVSMKPSEVSGGVLFDWAVENKVRLLSLIPKKIKLEEVFASFFTSEEENIK